MKDSKGVDLQIILLSAMFYRGSPNDSPADAIPVIGRMEEETTGLETRRAWAVETYSMLADAVPYVLHLCLAAQVDWPCVPSADDIAEMKKVSQSKIIEKSSFITSFLMDQAYGYPYVVPEYLFYEPGDDGEGHDE